MSTKPVTTLQVKAIMATLGAMKLMGQKDSIILGASGGRTSSTRGLTFYEAKSLLAALNDKTVNDERKQRMIRKLFAQAREIGWVKDHSYVAPDGKLRKDAITAELHKWVEKYGYLHKKLNQYTYEELPKLLTQFEKGPYKHYISNL